ncbi:hypothetical protein FGADI_7913 [Fusarium gaditjirri]|uniref:Uncharacterized protein n=1 Tax=Fusarium gaditjirri TaxID=282569 RepID=A0A8H4WUG2_9HYPO|nr:hypothetical protein FGADI_7913 [Fusarium gaditjirri]
MSQDGEDNQASEGIADPSVDAPSTRSWMTLQDVSSASPALIALLNNQEYMKLSNQVSKLTKMVADLKVGPRSRRSSASSRKSCDSDITNLIKNEAVDSFIEDDDILTIFETFITETGQSTNIRKGKKTLEYGEKFRDAAVDMIKKSWNPDTLDETIARLISFEDHEIIRLYNGLCTVIDGGDTTLHRRGEKRKAPKTPAPRRQRIHPSIYEDDEYDEYEQYTDGHNQPQDNGESSSAGLG